jgi:hypothetical protein
VHFAYFSFEVIHRLSAVFVLPKGDAFYMKRNMFSFDFINSFPLSLFYVNIKKKKDLSMKKVRFKT